MQKTLMRIALIVLTTATLHAAKLVNMTKQEMWLENAYVRDRTDWGEEDVRYSVATMLLLAPHGEPQKSSLTIPRLACVHITDARAYQKVPTVEMFFADLQPYHVITLQDQQSITTYTITVDTALLSTEKPQDVSIISAQDFYEYTEQPNLVPAADEDEFF